MATRYDTRYGLSQPIVNYLNLGLPDISGILGTPQALALAAEEEVAASSSPQIIYSQEGRVGDGSFNPYTMGAGDPGVRGPDDYSPYSARRYYASTYKGKDDRGIGIPSGILSDPTYLYPKGVTDTGIMGAYKQFRKSPKSLQAGMFGLNLLSGGKLLPAAAGVVAAGDVLGGLLPVSRRGIVENQLLGQGISLDNIGRVVGDPNTAEGIMAGYNAYQIDEGTFKKRREGIMKGLMKTNPEAARERLALLDEAEAKFLQANKIGDALYTQKMSAKDPNYKADMDKVKAGLLEGDDDDDKDRAFKEAQKETSGIIPFGPNPAFYASQRGGIIPFGPNPAFYASQRGKTTGTRIQPGSGRQVLPGGKTIQDNRRDKGPSPIKKKTSSSYVEASRARRRRDNSSPKPNRPGGKKSGAKKSSPRRSSSNAYSASKKGFR